VPLSAALRETFVRAQFTLAGVAANQERRIHARDHRHRFGILWIQFHRVDELAPRVRPTSHLHQLRPADIVAGRIAIGLQNAFPSPEEFTRTLTSAAQAKLEYSLPSRSVLPQVGLMIFPALVVHLHRNRGFIGL
jgi:hypothetical protein